MDAGGLWTQIASIFSIYCGVDDAVFVKVCCLINLFFLYWSCTFFSSLFLGYRKKAGGGRDREDCVAKSFLIGFSQALVRVEEHLCQLRSTEPDDS